MLQTQLLALKLHVRISTTEGCSRLAAPQHLWHMYVAGLFHLNNATERNTFRFNFVSGNVFVILQCRLTHFSPASQATSANHTWRLIISTMINSAATP